MARWLHPYALVLGAIFVAFGGRVANAVDRTSTGTGNWSVPGTWSPAGVPGPGDGVTIVVGHTVTVDINSAVASTTTINGTLAFSRVSGSTLTLVQGNITVNSGGTLDMGTPASPIPTGVNATLILAYGGFPGQYSLTINDGGSFTVMGASVTPAAYLADDITPLTGTSFSVASDPAAMGWNVGDQIVIGATRGDMSQVERRMISAITGQLITVDSSFAFYHDMAAGVPVANLKRNVLVRSSGTVITSNSAWLTNLNTLPGRFAVSYGEFAYLGGGDSAGNCTFCGVQMAPGARAVISSSTIHDGYTGIVLDGSGPFTLASSLVYNNADNAIQLSSASKAFIYNNALLGNSIGIQAVSSFDNVIASNTISGNTAGINFITGCRGNIIASNNIYSNEQSGLDLSSGGASGNILVADNIYSNRGGGLKLTTSPNTTCAECHFGYAASQSPFPDGGGSEIYFGGVASSLVLKNATINSSLPMISGLNLPGSYALSYHQDSGPGEVRLYGDYLVANSTLTLDYGTQLFASTASTPLRSATSVSNLAINSTNDSSAVSQLISVIFRAADSRWHVIGSVSGDMGSLPSAGGTASFPVALPQFNITLSAIAPVDWDNAQFALIAASKDANTQKKLLFGSADPAFNGGRSRLVVAPSGGFRLTGATDVAFNIMDRFNAANNYYTFIDSGVFTAAYARVQNADPNGLQLSGGAGVALSSCTFDLMGTGGSTSTYVTARGLTSNATFYNITFNVTRTTATVPYAYNILVQPPDGGLLWSMQSCSGPFSGVGYDYDPDGVVFWSDTVAPNPVTDLTAVSGPSDGQVQLNWSFSGDNGGVYPINRGAYRIAYSTDAAFINQATPAQAQIEIAPISARMGDRNAYLVSGLYAGTTYFFRVFVADTNRNWSSLSNGTTAQATDLVPPMPAAPLSVAVSSSQINLSWPAVAVPDLDRYNIYFSSVPPYTAFVLLASTPTTAFFHTGLTNRTTFVYQVSAVDYGNDPKRPGFVSIAYESPGSTVAARTLDVIPPGPVTTLLARPGANPGEVLLSWSAPGNDGYVGALAGGSLYRIQYSTYVVAFASNGAQVQISTFSVSPGDSQSKAVAGLTVGTSFYFALWTTDESGNWSATSNVSTSFPRSIPPTVVSFSPAAGSLRVATTSQVIVTFSAAMDPISLSTAVTLTTISDSFGNTVNTLAPATTSYIPASSQFVFSGTLTSNTLYQVAVTTQAKDIQGNALAQATTAQFSTLVLRSAANVIRDAATGVTVTIPAGALPADGYIQASTTSISMRVAVANQKLAGNTGDATRYPLPGSIVDLKALDMMGAVQSSFASPVMLSFPYSDAANRGIVDGTNPPVRVDTLSLWWLDEANALWVRLPTSTSETAAKRVTAFTPHFTTFALIGQSASDLSAAYAFPVPFRPSQGHTKITFTGLGQNTQIRIFTITGGLVKVIGSSSVSGQVDWDVTNTEGKSVASGVYLYLLEDGSNKAKGKLVIIR